MSDLQPVPRPGSPDARAVGCTCPVIDNNHGGPVGPGTGTHWWYNRACLVHREEIAARMNCAAAISAEVATRRRLWIGGVPTPADIDAMVRHLVHRLKVPEAIIRETLSPITVVP